MSAEIISIGSELTSGQNLDTNSQWLSRRLAEVGIPVTWHTTVADDLEANTQAFALAARRASLVLITGGLGPTQDDLTREALARAAGVELVFDQQSLEQIAALFARRGRTMPERNHVQAMFPAGAEPIPNDHGTAPGVWMRLHSAILVAMPGVPSEMYAMFQERVLPRLRELGLARGVLIQRKINVFGAGESAIEEQLLDLTRRGNDPEVGITVSDAVISLRILARAASEAEALARIAPIEELIRERLAELVFGVEDEDLEHAVFALLERRRKTLSVAESITGGLIAHRLTALPGASAWFVGGVTAYCNRLKTALLGVPTDLLEEHGAVSAPVAEAMAVGCRMRLGTDLALATTGVAGPDDGGSGKPVGTVFAALAWDGGVKSVPFSWGGTRREVQSRTAKMALNLARLWLAKGATDSTAR